MTPIKDERAEATAKSVGGLLKRANRLLFFACSHYGEAAHPAAKHKSLYVYHLDLAHFLPKYRAIDHMAKAWEAYAARFAIPYKRLPVGAISQALTQQSLGKDDELKEVLLDLARDKETCQRLKRHYAPDQETCLTPAQQYVAFKRRQGAEQL
jgi:hypothetical protein